MTNRIRRIGYRWHLRQLMATRGMFSTTDLQPPLAERGIELSPVQVYRLVAQTPERLNLHTLAALCDILGCTPAELIEPVVQAPAARAKAAGDPTPAPKKTLKPRRAEIVPED
ncbi:MAG TPA: helix-turn-helix transcriptional regulator [Acidimicrobiales bacterium]|nr:helix-turn-helix transcriptional regulator [Acidimicrobiales bacterium]